MVAENPVERLRRLLDVQADEVIAAERAAARVAAAGIRAALGRLTREITHLWLLVVGDLDTAATPGQRDTLNARLRPLFAALAVDPRPDLTRAAEHALGLGVTHAMQQAGGEFVDADRLLLPHEVEAVIGRLPGRIRGQVDQGLTAAAAAERYTDLAAAADLAGRAAARAEANARWVVNRSVAAGTQHAAGQLGLQAVWRAERNACLRCTSYAGAVNTGGGFLPVRNYTDRPLDLITRPPAHPSCRCQLCLWSPAWRGPGPGDDLPAALAREARRSVVKGWSLPSESEAARLRAARRLLESGAGLPKTVVAEGRTAVRRGRFKTRRVP
jgi:hypothetical protein